MRYRIGQIKINPYDVAARGGGISERTLLRLLDEKIRMAAQTASGFQSIKNVEVIRESVDARRKRNVSLAYTVDFDCDTKLPFSEAVNVKYVCPKTEHTPGPRPVVAGFGPCGIFAALILAEAGLRPIVVERGKPVDERFEDVKHFWETDTAPDPESNVQFGEGGAGTFSDGKLTTGIRDVRIRKVLEEFVLAGADHEILIKQKPHLGTDRLREVVKNIRRRIESMGGEIRFSTRLDGLETEDGRIRAVKTSNGRIETDWLILAIGHSARDTFRMLYEEGFAMEQKPFSIGVRVEHPQKQINKAQYGDEKLAEIIGPADYKLNYKCRKSGRGVYTFCMCPGGEIINASTEAGSSVTNGMSDSARDSEHANSGLLVDVRTSDFGDDHPLAGIEFQRKYEKLAWENRTSAGMAQSTYGAFRDDENDPVRKSIPAFASESILEAMPNMAHKLHGFDHESTRLCAVESRSSSPVRILRDESMQSSEVRGVIPAGEGPGYAGGIMSAAVDGIKAAEQIIILK